MHTLTVRQPHAALIVNGVKKYETRSWATNHRGPLIIHSGKIPANTYDHVIAQVKEMTGFTLKQKDLVQGYGLGIVSVVDCVPTSELSPTPLEKTLGNWDDGRFAWQLEVLYKFEVAMPKQGKQGIWRWYST